MNTNDERASIAIVTMITTFVGVAFILLVHQQADKQVQYNKSIYEQGYRQGQIDALEDKWKFRKVVLSDTSFVIQRPE